ncbi:universal stress protein [Spongiimicrobium salis]|uniref:universal stress protein n=1 Tax=Spongiimicrobium salis TaxID=1667022 RepID=UPI00374C9A98
MKKRVLIPTDFSKNALNAIRFGLDLYLRRNCEFYFLNVYQVKVYSLDNMMVPEPGDNAYEAAKQESADGFSRLMDILSLRPKNQRHEYHTVSSYNSLLDAMKGIIAEKDIDIVIMGTKGATGAKAVIFGTNTVMAMEKITECPVLAIPEEYRFTSPQEIVFPTNYKTDFKRRELQHLLEIVDMYGATIHILHIEQKSSLTPSQKRKKKLLEDILGAYPYEHHRLEGIKVHQGIYMFLEIRKSDMIAFVNKKHLFFGSILSNPLVKEMGYEAKIPVFVLNDKT